MYKSMTQHFNPLKIKWIILNKSRLLKSYTDLKEFLTFYTYPDIYYQITQRWISLCHLNIYQIKSLQWLQNVGCLKNLGTNLWFFTSWTFFWRRAPLLWTPLLNWFSVSAILTTCDNLGTEPTLLWDARFALTARMYTKSR